MQIVNLTDLEAMSFIEWRKNQAKFETLLRSGFFGFKNGSVTTHFNHDGEIMVIEVTKLKLFHNTKISRKTNNDSLSPQSDLHVPESSGIV